jgi:cytidylate kinase
VTREIVIAIDGYSSCGKSTLAKDLATALHYLHVDSGALYRAVTLYFIRHQIDLSDPSQVEQALENIQIRFLREEAGNSTVLNGENVEEPIRGNAVTHLVSPVAAISSVRRFLVEQQRELAQLGKGLVMDGRDIGTVVFPEAELKIFLTASKEVRVERRYIELLERGMDVTKAQIEESLLYRDNIDSTRADSPLRQAHDAVVIDNTDLTREQQLQIAHELAITAIQGKA